MGYYAIMGLIVNFAAISAKVKGREPVEKEKFVEKLQKLVEVGKSKKSSMDINEIQDYFASEELSKEQMDHVVREVSGRVAVNAEVTAEPLFHEVFAAPCPLETVKPVPILKSGNGSGKSTAFTALTVRAAPFEFGNGVRSAVAAGADEFGRTDFIGFL